MLIAILVLNVILLILILGIGSTLNSLNDRVTELTISVEGTMEKLDEVFPDREITENDV
ncbi:hypothetical protein K2P47_02705 [Patescibacteria group bacterium]|nr:hypothetical protein [Patescibacteria group bacterium]